MQNVKLQFSRQFSEELKQKQAVTDSLVNKILYSKRLLVDHVEVLEQCMQHLKDAAGAVAHDEIDGKIAKKQPLREVFTTRNTCVLLGTTLLEYFIIPKSIRLLLVPSVLIASGFSAMYVVRNVFVCRNKIVERELEQLIHTIDEFGNCIRRNMTYFNEIIIMKQHELIESRQIERAWDCITAAKEVTDILYEATRTLEADYLLPPKLTQYYSPMEELRDCEYFKNNVTDYSPKHIKDFHNIFAYVQSQFLLRLALTLYTKPSLSKLNAELVKIDCIIRQLVQEEESHFQNLAIEQNKKQQREVDSLNETQLMQNRSGPVAVLQDSSLKLSARMVAVAGECQALDIALQQLTETESTHKNNAKQMVEVANNMRAIESALSVCFDDFQRLMLVYNKFLHSKIEQKDEKGRLENGIKSETNDEFPDSILRVEISQNANEATLKDDFYAYMFDAKQAKAEEEEDESLAGKLNPDLEILNFEKRLTKGKFKPVLKQLKDRIDPIRKVMLEKEREVLAAKGINVDELFKQLEKKEPKAVEQLDNRQAGESAVNTLTVELDSSGDDSYDSDGSTGSAFKRRTKKLKERDNFAEMRNFLAQKQAINIFSIDAPNTSLPATGVEDVLESEC